MYIKTPNVEQALEQKIVRRVLSAALANGFSVAVFDEEEAGPITSSFDEAWDQLGETDIDRLYLYEGKSRVGSVLFIWSNGAEVVSDWSWNEAFPDSEVIIEEIATA
jgi:hypothetical protein